MRDKIELDYLKKERIAKLHSLNADSKSNRYKIEDMTTDAITEGNMDKLSEILHEINPERILAYLADQEPTSLLRSYKNFLLNINTYARIAAKNGGVLSLYLHLISERYTSIIESSETVDFLNNHVFYHIYYDYCDAVIYFSTNEYSDVMAKIVNYITENLTTNLTLKDIAEKYEMHPVHLARKFKQETGITFIAYINQQRIFLSKYYFHLQKYQLSEVAYLSGFNSHSYFTKVFKKISGETPTKYLRKLKSGDITY